MKPILKVVVVVVFFGFGDIEQALAAPPQLCFECEVVDGGLGACKPVECPKPTPKPKPNS
jgi:hypothetical protein